MQSDCGLTINFPITVEWGEIFFSEASSYHNEWYLVILYGEILHGNNTNKWNINNLNKWEL